MENVTSATLPHQNWNDLTTAQTDPPVTERPYQSFPIFTAGRALWEIGPAFVLLFGVFGNVMIIVIMRRMTSSESTINIYFTATAVMDLMCLCSNTLGEWMMYAFDFRISGTNNVVCKIYIWIYTGGGTISCWYLVCMTVHRAISVVWPHRVNLLCTRRTVLLLVAAVTVFFGGLYSHFLIGYERVYVPETNTFRCSLSVGNKAYVYFLENIFAYIELSCYSLIPFIFLAVANCVLVWKLTLSVRAASKTLSHAADSEQVQAREKAANSVTLTVIVVSIAFLVLTLPTSLNYTLSYFDIAHQRISGYDLAVKKFITYFCTLLGHANSAVNFYLYILTGKRFREEFIKVMGCGGNRQQSGAVAVAGDHRTRHPQSSASSAANADLELDKRLK